VNLEALFEKELREYFSTHRGIDPDKLDDIAVSVYGQWADKPCAELEGKTPRAYVSEIDDPNALIAGAMESVERGGEPSPLFAERIIGMPSALRGLIEILSDASKPEAVRTAAAQLLGRTEKLPINEFTDLIFDPDTPTELRETLIDRLKYEKNIGSVLIERMAETDGEGRKILAELFVRSGERNDGILEMLLSLLDERGALPFAAQLLAEYGDSRAIEKLSELAETCDYADYTELRNAVEMLGGELTLRLNWDGDRTYKIIKGE